MFRGETYEMLDSPMFAEMAYFEKASGSSVREPATGTEAYVGAYWMSLRRADAKGAPTWAEMMQLTTDDLVDLPEPDAEPAPEVLDTPDPTDAATRTVAPSA